MIDNEPADVESEPAAVRDFDGLYKALLEAHPRDALHVLCCAPLDGGEVVLDGPTEQPRQRSRQRDKVFLVRRSEGVPADVYHVEVQVQRTEDFQERMVAYWAALALKYRRTDHRIHQVVLWPLGGGYPGYFRRDQAQLDYRSGQRAGGFGPRDVAGRSVGAACVVVSETAPGLGGASGGSNSRDRGG